MRLDDSQLYKGTLLQSFNVMHNVPDAHTDICTSWAPFEAKMIKKKSIIDFQTKMI